MGRPFEVARRYDRESDFRMTVDRYYRRFRADARRGVEAKLGPCNLTLIKLVKKGCRGCGTSGPQVSLSLLESVMSSHPIPPSQGLLSTSPLGGQQGQAAALSIRAVERRDQL